MQPTASAAIATRPSSRVARNWAVAPAAVADEVGLGHAAVGEGQAMGVGGVPAELVVGRLDVEAGRSRGDDDGRDLGLAVVAHAGASRHGDERGDVGAGVGDEGLGTVDHPFAVVELGLGAGGTGVGARAGLGETEARERASGDQVGQPGVLLLLGAEGEDRVDAEAHGRLEGDAQGLVDPADLLDRDAQAGEVAVLAGAAVLLRRGQTHQPEAAHLLDDVGREVVVLVPLRCVGGDLRLRELADAATELLVLAGQLERHGHDANPRG